MRRLIITPWSHIIAGLHHRFNVSIRGQPLCTYLFQEPFVFQPGSCLYRFVHTIRTISQSLLLSLFSFRARIINRSISYLSAGPCSKTALHHFPNDPRLILSPERASPPIRQCWNQLERLPYRTGYFRYSSSHHSHLTSGLCCSYV